MPRFTDHARQRFQERRPDLFPPGIDPPHPMRLYDLINESYSGSMPASREEAEVFVSRRVRRIGNIFYRLDGVGLWVSTWWPGGAEVVITYVKPGEDPEVALHIEGFTGVASF